jgi:hypothetical protein
VSLCFFLRADFIASLVQSRRLFSYLRVEIIGAPSATVRAVAPIAKPLPVEMAPRGARQNFYFASSHSSEEFVGVFASPLPRRTRRLMNNWTG